MCPIKKELIKHLEGNDIAIADLILSYLQPCHHCIRYDNVIKYYVKRNGLYGYDDRGAQLGLVIMNMCKKCMIELMLNHSRGKNGVFTVEEWEKYKLKY